MSLIYIFYRLKSCLCKLPCSNMSCLTLWQTAYETYQHLSHLPEEARIQLAHHGLEALKEVATQITVEQSCLEQQRVMDFVRKCILALQGLLLRWRGLANMSNDTIDLPLPPMPHRSVRYCRHPSRLHFLSDVQAALHVFTAHAEAFEAQPWLWLKATLLDIEEAMR